VKSVLNMIANLQLQLEKTVSVFRLHKIPFGS